MQTDPEVTAEEISSAEDTLDSYAEASEQYAAEQALFMAQHTTDPNVAAAYAQVAHEHIAHCEAAPTALESLVEASVYETAADVSATVAGDTMDSSVEGEDLEHAAVQAAFEDAVFVGAVTEEDEAPATSMPEPTLEEAVYGELLGQSQQNELEHHAAFLAEQAADEIVDHLVDGGVDVAVGVGCTVQPELCPALMTADHVYDALDPVIDAVGTAEALVEEAEATACYDAQQEALAHGENAEAAVQLYAGLDCDAILGEDHIDLELVNECVGVADSKEEYNYCYDTAGLSISDFASEPSEPTSGSGTCDDSEVAGPSEFELNPWMESSDGESDHFHYDAPNADNDELDFSGQFDGAEAGTQDEGCVQVESVDGHLNFSCFAATDAQIESNDSDLDFEGVFDVGDFESESSFEPASDAGFDGADVGSESGFDGGGDGDMN